MKWMPITAVSASLFSAALWAEDCPPAPDHSAAAALIYEQLRTAKDPAEAQVLSGGLWELWLDAPDEIAQAMLDDGMARRGSYDLFGARSVLTELIAYCPAFAEGYNQRAFASYLAQDFELALADLDRTLMLLPDHIGALSGKALTLIALGRDDEAQAVLRAALRLNPWLAERALLRPAPGTDL